MKPGKGKQSFYLILSHDCFKEGNIILSGSGKALVEKRYTRTWWKRILNAIGFKFRTTGLKCKPLD